MWGYVYILLSHFIFSHALLVPCLNLFHVKLKVYYNWRYNPSDSESLSMILPLVRPVS